MFPEADGAVSSRGGCDDGARRRRSEGAYRPALAVELQSPIPSPQPHTMNPTGAYVWLGSRTPRLVLPMCRVSTSPMTLRKSTLWLR